jgi:hypothetical protein
VAVRVIEWSRPRVAHSGTAAVGSRRQTAYEPGHRSIVK